MTLISFVNLGIAAMTGLLLNMGSVGNTTMNQTVASDEAVESKGCAANFGKRTDLMFKYILDEYDQHLVEDLNNWMYLDEEDIEEAGCNDKDNIRACVIFVDGNSVYFPTDPNTPKLNPSVFTLSTSSSSTNVYYVVGATQTIDIYNEKAN